MWCYSIQLTSLDVSNNTALTDLRCNSNQLASLDLSNNTALTTLWCYQNQLASLDLSNNTALTTLWCYQNQLASLDLRNGNNQNFLSFNVTSNLNLTCINVDDVTYSTNNWTNIDAQHYFSTNCPILYQTYVPDDNFEAYLEANNMGNGTANDDSVTTSNINTVTYLDVSSQTISDLTGIEDFTALTTLSCYSNQLTSLDVSQNTALTTLSCGNNQLISLDVSQNTALLGLGCDDNQLTSLDVSNNTALTTLWCYQNQLASLDLRNGNNQNFLSFNVTSNLNLTCINVDDVTYSTNNWTNIDAQHYFSTNCTSPLQTYVPDDNFEAYLEANGMGNGIANDDSVTTSNIIPITSLDVSSQTISDLTGIEDFTALTTLSCYSNQLTSLDVSQNTALTTLRCYSNQLNSLDVSNNTALTLLYCYSNQLTVLDVSNNTALTSLNCNSNQLTSIGRK